MATLKPGSRGPNLRRQVKHRGQPEFQEQAALFTWARLPSVRAALPGIHLLEGSLNGVKLSKAQAGKAKAAGMLKGSHDVRLPVARGMYIGLSIEMKAGDNMPTDEQLQYGAALEAEGWLVRYCWSWAEAQQIITDYLRMPRPSLACP